MASLHEIDIINSRMQAFLFLFAGDTGEIKPEVRNQINTKVAKCHEEGKVEIIPGVCILLRLKCCTLTRESNRSSSSTRSTCSTLNHTLENDLAPLVVIACNGSYSRGQCSTVLMDYLWTFLITCSLSAPNRRRHGASDTITVRNPSYLLHVGV